jgi:hypothetical protein
MNTFKLGIAAAAALVLAACSDAGSYSEAPVVPVTPPPATTVPASATASTQAYTQFTGTLTSSETASPLTVGDVTPPTSESDAPQALI